VNLGRVAPAAARPSTNHWMRVVGRTTAPVMVSRWKAGSVARNVSGRRSMREATALAPGTSVCRAEEAPGDAVGSDEVGAGDVGAGMMGVGVADPGVVGVGVGEAVTLPGDEGDAVGLLGAGDADGESEAGPAGTRASACGVTGVPTPVGPSHPTVGAQIRSEEASQPSVPPLDGVSAGSVTAGHRVSSLQS